MVTTNRWNNSAMLARLGEDVLTPQEAEARRKRVEERWREAGESDAKAGIDPQHINVRWYLDSWLAQTQYLTATRVHETGHGFRFHCKVAHAYDSKFESFHVDCVVATASLKALTTLIRSTFGRDVCIVDWEAAAEPF